LADTGEVGSLTLRAVARDVGVATTSIYLHFDSLDALVLAVKDRFFTEFGEVLDAAAAAAPDRPEDRVRARMQAYVEYGTSHPGRYRVLFNSQMSPAYLQPAPYIGSEVFEAVRREVADALDSGGDPEMVALHFWTALHGSVTLRASRRNFPWPPIEAELDSLIRLLLGTHARSVV
jgi:AcrR family transcriptional regulator